MSCPRHLLQRALLIRDQQTRALRACPPPAHNHSHLLSPAPDSFPPRMCLTHNHNQCIEVLAIIIIIILTTRVPGNLFRWTCLPMGFTSLSIPTSVPGQTCLGIGLSASNPCLSVSILWRASCLVFPHTGGFHGKSRAFFSHFCFQPVYQYHRLTIGARTQTPNSNSSLIFSHP